MDEKYDSVSTTSPSRISSLETAIRGDGTGEDRIRYNSKGMDALHFDRLYTESGINPLDKVQYEKTPVKFFIGEGKIFSMNEAEFPVNMSQNARNIAAGLYFRKAGVPGTGGETSFRQTVERLGMHFRKFGEEHGYFRNKEEADSFEAEYNHLVINQMLAPNSPVWFNVGLNPAYGLSEKKDGMYAWDFKQGKVVPCEDSLARPQGAACFILDVKDDLLGPHGIQDIIYTEARLFKYGSGSGANWSRVRATGESLSSGGYSSGVMSFLQGPDKSAGALKSGGTTRRAAKMVVLDIDHPEIEQFIQWKLKSEKQVAAMAACGYSTDYRGEAYQTVSGQNSNNSVRIPDAFMEALINDREWELKERTTGKVVNKIRARDLWDKISESCYGSGDPGVQFSDTINYWNTVLPLGKIRASNPCSEYLFLDDTACNLASINILAFTRSDGKLDIERFKHAVRTSITQQELLVDLANYPRDTIAQNSHDLRPLGLGYSNLGAHLMVNGVPYDSDKGRTIAAAITAIMTGEAYAQSARLAARLEAFPRFEETKERFMDVMKQHRDFAYKIPKTEGLEELISAARESWATALELGAKYGYRNAQTTVIAPTGTIGLVMDSDTTGPEPFYGLVTIKKLAGGGNMKFVARSIGWALRNLGYTPAQVKDAEYYIKGRGRIDSSIKQELIELGFTENDINKTNNLLEERLELSDISEFPINPRNLARHGADRDMISKVMDYVNGAKTIEGAPHVRHEHYPIFDCANPSGKGKRFISVNGHIDMLGNRGIGPFLSGGASKTINLSPDAAIEDIADAYLRAWREGVKVVAIYPDGAKLSQPLNTQKDVYKPRLEWGAKKELPFKRGGFTLEILIDDQPLFIRTGEYEDGRLGEIFLDMYREGAPFRQQLNSWAVQTSKSLKLGMSLPNLIGTYLYVDGKPNGIVKNLAYLRHAPSIQSLVGRVLGMEYLGVDKFKEHFGDVMGMDFRNIDPAELRITQINEWNNFLKYMRIVRGDHLREARREAKANKSRKLLVVPNIETNGKELNLGEVCKCGGFMIRTGTCKTCSSCGYNEGCG